MFLSCTHVYCGKPRERDFLKTLRLVSAAEACAVEQHGDAEDDDKGVGVARHTPLRNTTNARVPWSLTRVDRKTIFLSGL